MSELERAIQVIEDYFAGKASAVEYEAALARFERDEASRARLGRLRRDLLEPGGLTCEMAREQMLPYLDPIARPEMSREEQAALIAHLASCQDCEEELAELRRWAAADSQAETEEPPAMPRFKLPLSSPENE